MDRKEQIIEFIDNFRNHLEYVECAETIRRQFRAGYCYHFAVILKDLFKTGKICWCAPLGHICWVDDDGIPYDIEGVLCSEYDYLIPIYYIGDAIKDFQRIPGEGFNASKEFINECIERYKKDNNL